jgi:AcrR family transcriptional regulator
MPKQIDHDERRQKIVRATLELLAEEGGFKDVSIRRVANRLGGSSTMVTHYYPTRSRLLEDFADALIETFHEEIEALDRSASDPVARLQKYLEWALPTTPERMRRELVRIRLLADREAQPYANQAFRVFDSTARKYIEEHLLALENQSDSTDLGLRVELLRVVITGVTVLAIEHQDVWTPAHQLAFMDSILQLLGIGA